MAGGPGEDGVADCGEKRTGIEFRKRLLGVEAESAGASYGGGIGDGTGRFGIAVDAVRAGAEDGEAFAGMVCKLESASESKLLIAAARARRAREVDSDFAHGDEAEPAVLGSECVKAFKQIVGGFGVVPVVATIVDHDMIAGFPSKRARALNQVVA